MVNIKSKKVVLISAGIIVIFIIGFFVVSNNKSAAPGDDETIVLSQLDRTTSTSKDAVSDDTTPPDETNATVEPAPEAPLTSALTGVVDDGGQYYISPRWAEITGGDSDKKPTTSISDPANSDLDKATFTTLRDLAIDVIKSGTLNQGSQKYPTFYSVDTVPSKVYTCANFTVINAGAIKIPYTTSTDYFHAEVDWSAKCSGDVQPIVDQTTVYFKRSGSGFTPLTGDKLPA